MSDPWKCDDCGEWQEGEAAGAGTGEDGRMVRWCDQCAGERADELLGQLGFVRAAPKPREPQRKH